MNRNPISSLAPLLLFAIFTVCILSVLLTGADTYQNLLLRDQTTFDQRTAVQYLTTRIRQNDSANHIFAGRFEEISQSGDTLFLKEEIDGKQYLTRIYCHDGYLRELFSPADVVFSPADGEKILKITDLEITLESDMLYIEIVYPDGETSSLTLKLRGGKEAFS